MSSNTTHVHTLRARVRERPGAESDPRVPLRLAARLETADWRPSGLPPSAVLVIRRVADPRPGALRLDAPGGGLDPDWERAVRDRLASLLEGAARPVRGRLEETGDAVLFRDESEARACWWWTALRTPGVPWWMQALERTWRTEDGSSGQASSRPSSAVLARGLGARPRRVAPILGYWTDWGAAESVVRLLSPPEAHSILEAVLAEYGGTVPDPSGFGVPPAPGGDEDGDASSGETPSEDEAPGGRVLQGGAQPGWYREWIGLLLALHRRPARVHERAFRGRVRRLLGRLDEAPDRHSPRRTAPDESARAGESRPERLPAETGGSEGRTAPDGASAPSTDRSSEPAGTGRARTPGDASDGRHPAERGPGASGRGDTAGRAEWSADHERGPSGIDPAADRGGDGAAERRTGIADRTAGPFEGPRTEATEETDTAGPKLAGRSFAMTDVGGIFFLLNLLEDRDLPRGPERPWARLEVLGRALLGGACPNDDPLWRVLAVLDGRAPDEPVGKMDEPGDLLAGAERRTGSLRVRLARRLGRGREEAGQEDDEERDANGGEEGDAWLRELIFVEASIYRTRTHLDVLFPMEAARLDVRRAGLDRDPGWLASGGRVVKFYFLDRLPHRAD